MEPSYRTASNQSQGGASYEYGSLSMRTNTITSDDNGLSSRQRPQQQVLPPRQMMSTQNDNADAAADEKESLLPSETESSAAGTSSQTTKNLRPTSRSFFRRLSHHYVPARWDIVQVDDSDMNVWSSVDPYNKDLLHIAPSHNNNNNNNNSGIMDHQSRLPFRRSSRIKRPKTTKIHRSLRRRIFLLLTEPDTSIASAIFFFILVVTITLMNLVMVMQTMTHFQFTPTDCIACGGSVSYAFDDDGTTYEMTNAAMNHVECVCPPAPLLWTVTCLDSLIYFFTLEWSLRVLCFTPAPEERASTALGRFGQWLGFVTSSATVLDFLAIFPYYFEAFGGATNGLMPLRLLRLFRVFQLVRLGQYNASFTSLTRVMIQSMVYLKLLMGVLLFGAAFFGSMMYWLERGEWEYWPETESWQFVRESKHQGSGVYELSPYTSIPNTFWWFLVTASTVGYGDQYPTSTAGKWVATGAMFMGVLVIAFPVSVFSDLWSRELKRSGAIASLFEDEEEDDDDNNNNNNNNSGDQEKAQDSGNSGRGDPSPHQPSVPQQQHLQHPSLVWPVVDPYNSGVGVAHHHEDFCVLEKNDLADIMIQMQSMQDSQRQIRNILRKYKIHFDSSSPPAAADSSAQRPVESPRGMF